MAGSGQKKDLYARLGVARDASEAEIKKAYRRLARKHHPDVNPGDAEAEARFKEISEAYAILSDAEKRRLYDEFGEISLEGGFDAEAARRARQAFGGRFEAGGASGFGGESFAFGGLDDLLGDLFERRGWSFEGGPRRGRPGFGAAFPRGADLEAELELDFLEAALGATKRLVVQRPRADGGLEPETVTVRIPAGVGSGGRIRVPGKGAEAAQGRSGDLIARIRVRPHPVFRREGRDVHLEVPITLREAVLGAKIEIPTLEGRATVTIPPGSDSGRSLRLRGKGIPDPKGGAAGDLYATLQIRVPRGLDAEAKAHLEELAEFDPTDVRKELFR